MVKRITLTCLGALLLSISARANDPDTFDPSRRDPGWLAPAVQEAQARRQEIADSITDDFLERCARYNLSEWRETRQAARNDAWLHGDKEIELCTTFLRSSYYEPRSKLYQAAFDALNDGETTSSGQDRLDSFRRELEDLLTFKRQYGTALVERLERHAGEFITGDLSSLIQSGQLGAFAVASRVEPDEDPFAQVQTAITGTLHHIASEELLRRYAKVRESLATNALRIALRRNPEPSVFRPQLLQQGARWRDGAEREWAGIRERAIQAGGLTVSEFVWLDYFLKEYGQRPEQLEANVNSPTGRDILRQKQEKLRHGVGEEVDTFFEHHAPDLYEHLEEVDANAELSFIRPRPWKPERTDGPTIDVRFVQPLVFNDDQPVTVSLRSPDGAEVWRCTEPLVNSAKPMASCFQARGWFSHRGAYHLEVTTSGQTRTTTIQMTGDETRLEVVLDANDTTAPYSAAVTRILRPPEGVRLKFSEPSSSGVSWQFELVNGGREPILPAQHGWAASVSLEHPTSWSWVPDSTQPERDDEAAVTPADSRSIQVTMSGAESKFARRISRRAVVRFVTKDQAPGSLYELSAPLRSGSPSGSAPASGASCFEKPFPPGIHIVPGFQDLLYTHDGLLATHDTHLVRIAEGRLIPLFDSHEQLLQLAASSEGNTIALLGPSHVFVSEGGAYIPLDLPGAAAIAFAGDTLYVFMYDGKAWRRQPDGALEAVPLPDAVTWSSASFTDAKHGVVTGHCRRLLVTEDGGQTWTLRHVGIDAYHLVTSTEAWYATGPSGLFRSRDGGATFQRIVEGRWCGNIGVREGSLVVRCNVDGPRTSALLFSPDGQTFRPIPSELPLEVYSLALGPNGLIAAGGQEDALLIGSAAGVSQAYESRVARRKILFDVTDPPPSMFSSRLMFQVSVAVPADQRTKSK